VVYVPGAVPQGSGTANLQPLGVAGQATHLALTSTSARGQSKPDTSVTLFDQGLVQVLEAAVTGLAPKQTYVLALATRPDGTGAIEPLTRFMTNPAGSAVVNAIGPIRQVVRMQEGAARRYLAILQTGSDAAAPVPVQVQVP
jgi:hypothetical protein